MPAFLGLSECVYFVRAGPFFRLAKDRKARCEKLEAERLEKLKV
jgi:hypothetical protein